MVAGAGRSVQQNATVKRRCNRVLALCVHPQENGEAVLAWDDRRVGVMHCITVEGVDVWELMTEGGLHLSALTPDAILSELTERIEEKLRQLG